MKDVGKERAGGRKQVEFRAEVYNIEVQKVKGMSEDGVVD